METIEHWIAQVWFSCILLSPIVLVFSITIRDVSQIQVILYGFGLLFILGTIVTVFGLLFFILPERGRHD